MEHNISDEMKEIIRQSLANPESLPVVGQDGPPTAKNQALSENAAENLHPSAEDETSLSGFLTEERNMQVKRFYLNYPAQDKEGNDLHLYIEIEVDDEDDSYLNYWVGCEEYTAKRYIASVEGDLDGQNLLEIVKVKHIYYYIHEVRENYSYDNKF
ncbi:MAG: hypothetical protein HFG80_12510 [Eubacterium sp.]|nr:hypothetical protein [Eubacterium sp.]